MAQFRAVIRKRKTAQRFAHNGDLAIRITALGFKLCAHLLATAADEQRRHAAFLLHFMHKITDAGAEMTKRLKLISLTHRVQLLRNDKAAHDQHGQDRQRNGKGKACRDFE